MVKDPKNMKELTINVVLKSGESFAGKDITSEPFGDGNIVSFWHDNVIRCYSLADVKYFELVPND